MPAISSTPQPYLVARRPGLRLQELLANLQPQNQTQPLTFAQIRDTLRADSSVKVLRTIEPNGVRAFSLDPDANDGVVVASMTEPTAIALSQSPQLLVEPDHPLNLSESATLPQLMGNPSDFIPFGSSTTYQLQVLDENGAGLSQAAVHLYGDAFPATGTTAADGSVTITLQNQSSPGPRALYVNPQSGYWNFWISNPALSSNGATTITLSPLTNTFPNLASQDVYGWGQIAMGLDKIPQEYRGAGVKIAIVDSGAASQTHRDLGNIRSGRDLTVTPPSNAWTTDTIAHGSHCAGVVTGSTGTKGVRGFAPDADVHVLKVFPGGRFSNLLDALDYCIENGIDIVNMSLGSQEQSQLLLQKIAQAKRNGIACIVAAGNSAGQVQFPGSSPDVLTVAAIGKDGTFPATSYHAQQVGIPARGPGGAGYFSARFTCYGPKVDVCAPGVAILSSVPADGFAVWDGTSMAAPHVTGMAALILAHHPEFEGAFRARNAGRVDRLFQIIKQSAITIDVGDRNRTGVGLPNIERALQLSLPSTAPIPPSAWVHLLRALFGFQTVPTNATNGYGKPAPAVGPAETQQAVLALLDHLAQLQRVNQG